MFFIPIITPAAIKSHYCKFEFVSFPAREKELGRSHPDATSTELALRVEKFCARDCSASSAGFIFFGSCTRGP
jgi:hypothetical protein